MTDQELLTILDNGGEISVPYFNGDMIQIDASDLEPTEALPALKNFLTLSNDQRMSDARHLLAYCKLMMDAVGEEEISEDLGGVQPTLENIWNFTKASHIFFGKLDAGKYAAEKTVYLQLEGNVAWEPEHGLQMSWANGNKLVKAGPFDGHPTNGHAYADPERDQYVFDGETKDTSTLPD